MIKKKSCRFLNAWQMRQRQLSARRVCSSEVEDCGGKGRIYEQKSVDC
jgi:hypothetical protein